MSKANVTKKKKKSKPKTWVFVDYENSPDKVYELKKKYNKIIVFVGKAQKKVDIEFVKLGNLVEWVFMEDIGKNNLDFHLTLWLGICHASAKSNIQFVVVSRDTGFDSVIRYLNSQGRMCSRVDSLTDMNQTIPKLEVNIPIIDCNKDLIEATEKILKILGKLEVNKRPQKKTAFLNFIRTSLVSYSDSVIDLVIANLESQNLVVYTAQGKVSYGRIPSLISVSSVNSIADTEEKQLSTLSH